MKQCLLALLLLLLWGFMNRGTSYAAETVPLGVKQTIDLAMQKNFSVLISGEQKKEAEGKALETLAKLLPHLSGSVSQYNQTQNLRALGLALQGFPTIIGPYNTFDARLKLDQTVFDLSASRAYAADRTGLQIADLQEKLVQEQIASAAALAYMNVLRANSMINGAKADLSLAKDLAKLAEDQHHAGIATGIDVARAETALAQTQVKLSKTETTAEQASLQLNRITGLPLSDVVQLTDSFPANENEPPLPTLDQALAEALRQRVEVKIARQEITQNDDNLQSARDQGIPSLNVAADYGLSGNTINSYALPTRRFGFQLDIPIFNGGLTHGEIVKAESQKQSSELTLSDVRAQVEEDVRLAFQTVRTTYTEAEAAEKSLALAERELILAKDRFAQGVGDNIQVINAQTSLQNTRTDAISATADYNAAWLNFMTALGRAQEFEFQHRSF